MRQFEIDEVIKRMVREELIWYRHYWGQVLSNADRLNVGRVQVTVPDLRWNDQTSAPWCYPRYAPGLSVPAVGAWVEVYFADGKPSRPVWLGRVPEAREALVNFPGAATAHVLFEDPKNQIHILYDAQGNIMSIGNSAFQAAARAGDSTQIDSTTASAFMAYLASLTPAWTGGPIVGKITGGSNQVQIGSQ